LALPKIIGFPLATPFEPTKLADFVLSSPGVSSSGLQHGLPGFGGATVGLEDADACGAPTLGFNENSMDVGVYYPASFGHTHNKCFKIVES
jgi:hypothetical protein